jgi:hypothetical protein
MPLPAALAALLGSDDTTAVFWLAAVVVAGFAAARPSRDVATVAFVGCLVALAAGALVARHSRAETGGLADAAAAEGLLAAGDAPPRGAAALEATYQLLRLPARRLAAVAAHRDVVAALASLAPLSRPGDRAWLQRTATCLEDFYARYHDLLLLPQGRDDGAVRLEVPRMLDARREALNALHAVENSVVNSAIGPVRAAAASLRAAMARCLVIVARKHGGRAGTAGALHGVVWRAPYPRDPASSPHLVEL